MLFCKPHWFSTRRALQQAIWREYRPGQERDKRPSTRYVAVQQLCVSELLHHKSSVLCIPNALALSRTYSERAEEYRQMAISRGEGDPFELLARRSKAPEPQLSLFDAPRASGAGK